MEQFLSVQIGNRTVDMQAMPIMEELQGVAYFTFIVRATPGSPLERTSFGLYQASLLEDPLPAVVHMLSCIWGRIDDPASFVTLQYHLSAFCHEIIQQRNGLGGVGFYIYILSRTARILQQQRSINTNDIRGEVIDEGLIFTAAERGLDQTAIAKLERVDAARVLNHDNRCSICLEEFKEIMNDSGLARTPCSHMFHYECIAQWLKRSRACPLCRREI